MAANIDFVWSRFEASLQLACDLLSTCLRHAHASLRPGLQPGLQLARIMKCSLTSSVVEIRERYGEMGTFQYYRASHDTVVKLCHPSKLRSPMSSAHRDFFRRVDRGFLIIAPYKYSYWLLKNIGSVLLRIESNLAYAGVNSAHVVYVVLLTDEFLVNKYMWQFCGKTRAFSWAWLPEEHAIKVINRTRIAGCRQVTVHELTNFAKLLKVVCGRLKLHRCVQRA